jgi:hypothetical protein
MKFTEVLTVASMFFLWIVELCRIAQVGNFL